MNKIIVALIASVVLPAWADSGNLELTVNGLQNDQGTVRVALFHTSEAYDKSAEDEARSRAWKFQFKRELLATSSMAFPTVTMQSSFIMTRMATRSSVPTLLASPRSLTDFRTMRAARSWLLSMSKRNSRLMPPIKRSKSSLTNSEPAALGKLSGKHWRSADRVPALSQAEIWLELSATAPPPLCCSARNGVAIRKRPPLCGTSPR